MSGSRKRGLHVANTLGLACIAATCFLAACGDTDDSSSENPAKGGSSGSSGKAGTGGKAGSTSNGGASAGSGQAGDENVAGDNGEGGEGGDNEGGGTGGSVAGGGGSAGVVGGSAGTGGTAGGALGGSGGKGGSGGAVGGSGGAVGGSSGSAGAGGAAVVLVPNCVRDTTSGKKIDVNPAGNDGLYAAAYTPAGDLYAAGFVQDGILNTADRSTVVVKIKADGTLDTSWPTNAGAAVGGTGNGTGIVKTNVVNTGSLAGQGELPRGIAFQSNGKIIVAGTVEAYSTVQANPVYNGDRNVYVLRLNTDGSLDTTFGDATATVGVKSGIHILPLSEGVLNTAGTGVSAPDAQWGLNVLTDGSIIVTAATRSPLAVDRTDTDFAVVKLTPDGAQDTSFGLAGGTAGVFTLDIAQANASVRTASVLADGKLIVTGYSTYSGTQRPVIFKLNADGKALDTSFGVFGVFSDPVGSAAEAYGALVQKTAPNANKLVTVGYGRATATTPATDLLSIRLTAGGLLDTTYGTTTGANATPGRAWFDVYGLADNGRAIVLSDDRPVLIGGGNTSTGQLDAVVTLLSAEGKPVTTFGSPYGCTAYDFGSVGDFFWAGAVNDGVGKDGKIAAVGLTGHASTSTDDTDGILVLLNKP